jgi:hypothetical protein
MNTQKLDFLSNGSATTLYFPWRGGPGTFLVEATFGGGSVKLQVKGPNGTAIDVGTDTTLAANGGGNFDLPPCELRAAVTTATAVYAIAVSRQ